MNPACELFINNKKRHYGIHAAHAINKRLAVASAMIPVAYGPFIDRQPDGYVSSYAKPAREPYIPTDNEHDWLERLADYILAEDHAQGLAVLRDPYDKPRDADVYTPPGEGAVAFMRKRLAQEDAGQRFIEDIPLMRQNAYANSDYEAIEYILDAEADTGNGIVPEVRRQYIPEIGEPDGRNDVKLCVICEYPFEDSSRNKARVVCGEDCRRRYKTLRERVYRYGTELLEGERERMTLEYPFYSPAELWSLENRSERSYGSSDKVSGMIAAKQRKEQHGFKTTVKLVDAKGTAKLGGLNGKYTWTSDRNAYKFEQWVRRPIRWGPVISYNMNEEPLRDKFVDSRCLSRKICPWLINTVHISA
jgi:hypothetical protein